MAMFSRIRHGLTFANVCSALALVIALSTGTAYAANTVFSKDIVNGEVKTQDIHAGAVHTGKIDDGAITSAKVLDGTLAAADLGTDSVGSNEIAIGGVGSSEIADSTVTSFDVAGNALTTADIKGADVNGAKISLSAGAVANGRCEDFDVTIGGATAGEAVVFSLQSEPAAGMLFYGVRVKAANTVTLKLCNFTGGSSPAMSNIPVRVITFG
jgi:hypothetical protein